MKGTDPFYSTNTWRALRYRTLERDHWRCEFHVKRFTFHLTCRIIRAMASL